ncbi:MAG: hypothetical protein AB1752_07755 [Candidatus Zixiibacteriota bacterium]
MSRINWPDGKRFAFTVFDDTDLATKRNVTEVYELLYELGFRTTKSVWPLAGPGDARLSGDTCSDQQYLNWVLDLQQKGFEIGFHGATYHTSDRGQTRAGFLEFAHRFGPSPVTMAAHSMNAENIYWGADRLTGMNRCIYNCLTRFQRRGKFRGHVPTDPLFWGDICEEHVKYHRNFVFADINTIRMCPMMPYHDTKRPHVRYWFASSDGHDLPTYNRLLSQRNVERLASEGGACIVYTHFGAGFWTADGVDQMFERSMRTLAKLDGWFVPVGVLLDFLIEQGAGRNIKDAERARLERRWLIDKLRLGYS